MPSKKRGESVPVIDPNVCAFCNVSEDNEEVYGKLIKKCDLTVHYFCMLFSSGLSQGGKSEKEGIFGFMPEDIMKEVRRGARLRCSYCKLKGATIGCVVGACRRVFHFGCGRSSGTLHQYYDSFRSFCEDHRPRQTVSVSDRLAFYGTANTTCAICMTSVETRASNETLRAPCCRNSWFHRSCIVKHALTAGLYFFKCPLCNNKEIFQEEMLKFGVYLPDQDAAWETEPDAFHDLLERYLHCDATECQCPKGRDYNQDGQKWEIIVCDWCGSQGSHIGCHSLSKYGSDNICQDCKGLEIKRKGKKKVLPKIQSPVASKSVKTNLENKTKSEYPGRSDKLLKKGLPSRCSTVSSPPPSSTLSPGTVLRLSYEETDDDVDVDSIDNHPSGSEPSKIQQGKRKKPIKNTTSKRLKLTEDDVSSGFETSGKMSPVKSQPTATITKPETTPVSPVKSCVRQSALDIQAKRSRSGCKRTRSMGLTPADKLRLEKMRTNPNKVLKRSQSSCETKSPKKKYNYKDPWRYCKGFYSRKNSAKKKQALSKSQSSGELNAGAGTNGTNGRLVHLTDSKGVLRCKNSKGQFIGLGSNTSSCVEDTETSDDSLVNVSIISEKHCLLRTLLTSGKNSKSKCEKNKSKISSQTQQSAEIKSKRHSDEQISKISKKAKSKKHSKSSVAPGQMSITSWLTGLTGSLAEGSQTIHGTERGDLENNINFLNQSVSRNSDEKNLIIKYKGKKFVFKKENDTKSVFKKENDTKSEKAESINSWSKTEVISVGTSPAQSTRQTPSEKVDPVVHSMLQNSRPIGSSPALSTRQALMERKHGSVENRRDNGSVENRRKRMKTPKTFPRRKNKTFEPSDSSDLSDGCVYGTPRRSVRCSLNNQFCDNISSVSETDEKSRCDSPSSSATLMSSTSDLRLLYLESEDEEEDDTSSPCKSEDDSSECLILELEEDETTGEGEDCSVVETSVQMPEVMKTDSTGTEEPNTSTYIIQSFGGSNGFQQLSISVPSV